MLHGAAVTHFHPLKLLRKIVDTDPLGQSMQLMGAMMANPRNTEIFGENEPADYLYKVVSGSVRTYKTLSDGRRQVGGFYLPGDNFGLEFAEEQQVPAMTQKRPAGESNAKRTSELLLVNNQCLIPAHCRDSSRTDVQSLHRGPQRSRD